MNRPKRFRELFPFREDFHEKPFKNLTLPNLTYLFLFFYFGKGKKN